MKSNIKRRKTRVINVGDVSVGYNSNISVQSMTNTNTQDSFATLDQIEKIADAGADLVRVSCPDQESTNALKTIVKNSPIPIIADIHFHYKRAIEAADAGVACLRINPGNIGSLILKENDFHDFKISVKASDVFLTIDAYKKLAEKTDAPFHIGITEAGGLRAGTVKSSIGLGYLLLNGIGDTIRVSLSADPVEEVKVAFDLLKALNIYFWSG